MLPFQILVWKAVLIARGSSFQFKPSQALLLSLCCSSTGSGKDKIKYSLAWLPISFPLGPRDAAIAEEKPALWHCQCLAPSSFARPVNAAAWYILCSFRKWQFCWRSGFVKQTLFFSLFWGFFFHSLLTPHLPWASSKNNPRAILSHQRHKELLLPTHWLFRIQRS